jgi:hypothetical protein
VKHLVLIVLFLTSCAEREQLTGVDETFDYDAGEISTGTTGRDNLAGQGSGEAGKIVGSEDAGKQQDPRDSGARVEDSTLDTGFAGRGSGEAGQGGAAGQETAGQGGSAGSQLSNDAAAPDDAGDAQVVDSSVPLADSDTPEDSATVDAQVPPEDAAAGDSGQSADSGTQIPPECVRTCEIADRDPSLLEEFDFSLLERQSFVSAAGYQCPTDDGGSYWLDAKKCALSEWCQGGYCTSCGESLSSNWTKLTYDKGTSNEVVKISTEGCYGAAIWGLDGNPCPDATPTWVSFNPRRYAPEVANGVEWSIEGALSSPKTYGGATISSWKQEDKVSSPGKWSATWTVRGTLATGHSFELKSHIYQECP